MRFFGYVGENNERRIAVAEATSATDLCAIDEFYADTSRWSTATATGASVDRAAVNLTPAVPQTAIVLCLGLNYADHIAETESQRPPAPNIFARWFASLSCDGDQVPVPTGDERFDWECEMAVIIGAPLVNVSAADAMAGVLGYSCLNDISSRGYQRMTSQWALGKNADKSAPFGPVIVTADEFGDPYGKRISTRVNGETRQDSTTDHMIFKIAETIEFITECIALAPGDVIATGTPSGVGAAMDPPTYLTAGDTVEIEIEDIGVLTSHIVSR